MNKHRFDQEIGELEACFTSVIDWIESVFPETHDEMCGRKWGDLYERFHRTPYNATKMRARVNELMDDDSVTDKNGIFEYLLGGEKETKLINVRVFKPAEAKAAYRRQTDEAKKKGTSNCPLCAVGHSSTATRIWDVKDMDADHVTAWSKGGATTAANCQMLCKTHNRAKGNR